MAPGPLVQQHSNNSNMERPVARALVTGVDRESSRRWTQINADQIQNQF
jgi:hypothetical protein